jgi:DNA polymerase-3 subunit alpha
VNDIAIDELMQKYAKGNRAYQEMEALTYYYSFHELETKEYEYWLNGLGVTPFDQLPSEPIIEWQNGERKVFRLFRIVGTAIGRDKSKQIVGFLTPTGFIKVKFYRSQFIKYDKQIKENGVTEKSWFTKGSKLLLTGYRDGDTFIPKVYKNSASKQAIYKIEDVGTLVQSRLGE